ncbi:MAG: thioredoxin family protein [Acidobacteriota bacterium]
MRRAPSHHLVRSGSALFVAAVLGTLTLAAACARNDPPAVAPAPAQPSPSAPQPPPARPSSPPPLLGPLTRADLQHYPPWQPLFTTTYEPDTAAAASIKGAARDLTVLMIVATWCPDSKREVPRYFAIMDAAGIGDKGLTMIGVDRSKKDPEGLTEKWRITRVPTMVFLRHGEEVGRFVERTPPGTTLEAEIARMLGRR